MQNPRADSFSLYMNTVADIVLKQILPKKKLLAIKEHIEQRNQFLTHATYEQVIPKKIILDKKPAVPLQTQKISNKKKMKALKPFSISTERLVVQ